MEIAATFDPIIHPSFVSNLIANWHGTVLRRRRNPGMPASPKTGPRGPDSGRRPAARPGAAQRRRHLPAGTRRHPGASAAARHQIGRGAPGCGVRGQPHAGPAGAGAAHARPHRHADRQPRRVREQPDRGRSARGVRGAAPDRAGSHPPRGALGHRRATSASCANTCKLESAARRANDKRAIIRLSGDFHQIIADIAGNSFLARTMRELESLTCLVIILYDAPDVPSCPYDEHTGLIDAIEARDAGARRGADDRAPRPRRALARAHTRRRRRDRPRRRVRLTAPLRATHAHPRRQFEHVGDRHREGDGRSAGGGRARHRDRRRHRHVRRPRDRHARGTCDRRALDDRARRAPRRRASMPW